MGKQQQKKEVITKMLHYNVKILEKMYGGCHFGAKHLNCTQPPPLIPALGHFYWKHFCLFSCQQIVRMFLRATTALLMALHKCTSVQWAGARKTFSTGVGSVLLE